MLTTVRAWEAKIPRLTFRASMLADDDMEDDGAAVVERENCGQNVDDNELGQLRRRHPHREGTAVDSGVEDHYMVPEQKCVGDVDGPQ